MEHLNDRQFTSEAPSMHWDRHNYYSLEELKERWTALYNKAQEKYTSEDIHQRTN